MAQKSDLFREHYDNIILSAILIVMLGGMGGGSHRCGWPCNIFKCKIASGYNMYVITFSRGEKVSREKCFYVGIKS